MRLISPTYAMGFLVCALLFASTTVRAAEISNVEITEVSETEATISWVTDVNTDGTINYGLDTNFGELRDSTPQKSHTLTLDGLSPATTYHFRVISNDESGNKSSTAGFVFTTEGSVAEQIVSEIDKIVEPKDLEKVVKKVQKRASEVIKPPSIIGLPRVVVETDHAVISWTSDRESGSMVLLSPEDEFSEGSKDPYTIKQGDPKERTTKHEVDVVGLEPTTVYHFKVVSEDSLGLSGESRDDTFKTKSILPSVSNVKVTRIQEHQANISWSTGSVLAKGVVEYTNERSKVTKSAGNAVFATNQNLLLTGLEFGSRYRGVVIATNEGGENDTSQPFTFITVRDVIPPIISQVKNESTLYPSEDTKIQTIISWETDEPASCQVFYAQGLVKSADKNESLPAELNPLTKHTQVIVGFSPATVYKFWTKCHDEAGNEAQSDDFVLITPIKEKNIIDIILENFQGTFGWVNKIGK